MKNLLFVLLALFPLPLLCQDNSTSLENVSKLSDEEYFIEGAVSHNFKKAFLDIRTYDEPHENRAMAGFGPRFVPVAGMEIRAGLYYTLQNHFRSGYGLGIPWQYESRHWESDGFACLCSFPGEEGRKKQFLLNPAAVIVKPIKRFGFGIAGEYTEHLRAPGGQFRVYHKYGYTGVEFIASGGWRAINVVKIGGHKEHE